MVGNTWAISLWTKCKSQNSIFERYFKQRFSLSVSSAILVASIRRTCRHLVLWRNIINYLILSTLNISLEEKSVLVHFAIISRSFHQEFHFPHFYRIRWIQIVICCLCIYSSVRHFLPLEYRWRIFVSFWKNESAGLINNKYVMAFKNQ